MRSRAFPCMLVVAVLSAGWSRVSTAQDLSTTDAMAKHGFTIEIPGNPVAKPAQAPLGDGYVASMTSWSSIGPGSVLYTASVAHYPSSFMAKRSPTQILNDNREAVISQPEMTLTSERAIMQQGIEGREYVFSSDVGEFKVRSYFAGTVLYNLAVLYNPSTVAPGVQTFFDSFRFVKPTTTTN